MVSWKNFAAMQLDRLKSLDLSSKATPEKQRREQGDTNAESWADNSMPCSILSLKLSYPQQKQKQN